MKPQSSAFLDKARNLIERATKMFDIDLYEEAGRTAYLAGLHAAQAVIFETNGKTITSHKGVHGELGRLMKDEPRFDKELRKFLNRTYDLKAIADYETGPTAVVSAERASEAIQTARRFIETIAVLIPPNGRNPLMSETPKP